MKPSGFGCSQVTLEMQLGMRVHVDFAQLGRARELGQTTLLPTDSYKGIWLPLIAETI